jgi:hypothetical protein
MCLTQHEHSAKSMGTLKKSLENLVIEAGTLKEQIEKE